MIEIIYETRERVFHRNIQTAKREFKIGRTEKYFFYKIRDVWIADETLSRVFDISSSIETKTKE